MDPIEQLVELAARQHGVVARWQLRGSSHPVSRSALRHAEGRGRIERLSARVLRVRGSAATPHQVAMAAALDVERGLVALQSALALWGMPGYHLEPVHVLSTRTPHRGSEHLGVVHSTTSFAAADLGVVAGIPVTVPARVLWDLSARLPPKVTEGLCDDLLRRHLMTEQELQDLAARLPISGGPRGRHLLRTLALARPVGSSPTESRVEHQCERVLQRAGITTFRRQVEVFDPEGFIGRVDFADPQRMVVIEVQSATFHTSVSDRRRDALRIRRLRAAGWTVVEVTDDEVWRRPDLVVARVRRALEQARAHDC